MRLCVILILLLPSLVFAGENCASMGGVCKDSCGQNEEEIEGAFVDCDDTQDCCTDKAGGSRGEQEAEKEGSRPRNEGRDKEGR